MSDPLPRPDREAPAAGGVGSRRRVAVATFLVAHWLVVLVWALPDVTGLRARAERVAAPLPLVNTHRGEPWLELRRQPILQAYLIATAQRQRWGMFVGRRPNTSYLELTTHGDEEERQRMAELTGGVSVLGSRWRLLEAALLDPRNRETYVPVAGPRLAAYLFVDRDPGSVRGELAKRAYPVPLLSPDGTGNPLFRSAADYDAARARAETDFFRVPLGTFDTRDLDGAGDG